MLRLLSLPPLPDIPEPIRGKKLVAISAAHVGSQEEGERAIAPLREIGEPVLDTFGQVPAPALSRIAMDPEPPVPGLGHRGVVNELPDEAIDAFYEVSGPDSGSPLCSRSSATSAALSLGPPRTAARWTSSTANSCCSGSAC